MAGREPVSRRPYLLRAMHEWIADSGYTAHVIVDALQPGVEVPASYVKDGKIVLNLSASATQRLQLGNRELEFDARFGGVVHHVRVPIAAVFGIYARETGEGMLFSEGEPQPTPPPAQSESGAQRRAGRSSRARLTVVK